MKKPKLTSIQIVAAIKKQESGNSTKEVSRELGISEATFYNWKCPLRRCKYPFFRQFFQY